jgi:hypothetical protein
MLVYYTSPQCRIHEVSVSGMLCDSYTGNSAPNYNKRDDVSLDWDYTED